MTALRVGRLVVNTSLEALVPLCRDRDDVRPVVVGDGPERGWLEAALPGALFTGHLSGEALSRAYASADLLVLPSGAETLGNVALEATASGLPAVTSDRMAPRELIHEGVNGFVGRVGIDFHHHVERLIRDPALRRAMGASARRFALSRTWSRVCAGLVGDWMEVAARARARRRSARSEQVGARSPAPLAGAAEAAPGRP